MIHEIAKSDWSSWLESFTLQHDHWIVTVESRRNGTRDLKALDEPLEGVVLRGDDVVITVGGVPDQHRRIVVGNARAVRVESDDGVDRALDIEDVSGVVTRIAFRTPVAPQLVDGM